MSWQHVGTLLRLKSGRFSSVFFSDDVGKLLRENGTESQPLKPGNGADDPPSTPWTSGHIGGHQTIGKWTIYSRFHRQRWTLGHSRFPWQPARPPITRRHPFASSWRRFLGAISVVCRWIQGLERLQTSWTMSTMPAEEPRKNRGRTADERHPKPCCQALDGRPTTLRQLQSSGHVGRLQTMEFFDNSLRFSSPTTAELLLFTFATVLSKLGSDQPLINLFACRPRRQLALLSHHPLYAQLDSKSNTYARPFKKYDRATISHGRPRAGQRFWVSLPAEINGFVAGKRGLFSVNTEDLRLPDQLTTVSAMIAEHLLSSRHPLLFRQVFGLDSKDLGGF